MRPTRTVSGGEADGCAWGAKLTDLLATLRDCPKARSVSAHDRCKVVYERLDV
jgi:hypothetical protein